MENIIKFYMVPASPWSFLCLDRLENICKSYNLKLDIIPIDIFKIFEMNDIKMVSKRPKALQKNRLNELQRWKNHLNIKFNIQPKFFPVNPIKSCRLIIAASIVYPQDKDLIFKLVKGLAEAVWVNDLNIDNDDIIFDILARLSDSERIIDVFNTEKPSSILLDNTMNAIKNDVFGVPTFIFKNQMFWGQDRIFFLEKEIRKLNV